MAQGSESRNDAPTSLKWPRGAKLIAWIECLNEICLVALVVKLQWLFASLKEKMLL